MRDPAPLCLEGAAGFAGCGGTGTGRAGSEVSALAFDERLARASRFGFFLSGLFCAASILLFAFVGLNFGVDFKGGTNFVIRFPQAVNIDQLRTQMNALNLGEIEIQGFGEPTDVLLDIAVYSAPPAIRAIMAGLDLNYCYGSESGELYSPFEAGDRW